MIVTVSSALYQKLVTALDGPFAVPWMRQMRHEWPVSFTR